jgi:predicted alpha/beta superfamily hydrolase
MQRSIAMRKFITAICLLLALLGSSAPADERVMQALQSINPSYYHHLEPDVLGRPLHIVVKLPPGYEENRRKRYPVIYLLDGGAIFPMLAGYYNYLVHQNTVPVAILVALSYGSDDFEHGNHRSTDYTAPTDQRESWGGAAAFQQALKSDLFPLIESQYNADPGKRVLFGQSIGGQFVLFSALTEPDLFWGRVASNPALHRNLEFFLQRHSGQRSGNARLFVASASDDERRFREPAMAWIEHWSAEDDLPWTLRAITIEGYGHFSLITESFRQGMEWVFD